MGNLVVSDNAASTLAGSITNSPSVTSLTVADGSKFPVVNHGGTGTDWTYVTLYDGANNLEIVKVTRRDNASNVMTIVRGTAAGITGVNDASCKTWPSTTTGVANRLIAQTVNDISTKANDSAASAAAAAASVAPLSGVNGLIKGNGAGSYSAAVAKADYAPPTSGAGLLKGDGLGGFAAAAAKADYAPPTSGAGLLKGDGLGGFAAAAANTDYTQFAAGTRLVFAQAAAPTGWTQDTSDNADNRMLRVVKTAGGGVAGSHSPILNNVVPAHTHGFTTGGQSATHQHVDSGHAHAAAASTGYNVYGGVSNNNIATGPGFSTNMNSVTSAPQQAAIGGATGDHTHSGATDNGSSSTNWTPRYIDTLLCQKD